jgi:hypothetical protein
MPIRDTQLPIASNPKQSPQRVVPFSENLFPKSNWTSLFGRVKLLLNRIECDFAAFSSAGASLSPGEETQIGILKHVLIAER